VEITGINIQTGQRQSLDVLTNAGRRVKIICIKEPAAHAYRQGCAYSAGGGKTLRFLTGFSGWNFNAHR
jgi:hypothetical protein